MFPPSLRRQTNRAAPITLYLLPTGQKVSIPGFGVFEARTRAARKGRNPQTGEELLIAETVTPAFSAGELVLRWVACGHCQLQGALV